MGGMTVGISQSSGVDTLRCISCTHGSVTMLGESMCQLMIWNMMETFTNPGSCSSIFKMSITRLPADTFVHKNSSVMLGKVWGPRNDEIPFKDRIFKYRKRPSRRPEGSSKVCSRWLPARIVKERSVGMGSRRCSAIWSKLGEPFMQTVNVTSREAWGMIETTSRGVERMTSRGTDLDLSSYASSFDEEPPALHHNRGKESNTVRHC